MSTQRLIGIGLSIFTSAVILAHVVRSMLSWFDWVYGVVFLILVASIFWESVAMKVAQVFIIFLTGFIVLGAGDDGGYIGPIMMTFAYVQAYTYGAFKKNTKAKNGAWFTAFYLILVFGPGKFTEGDFIRGALWLMMCFSIQFMLWANARDLIKRAKDADEIIRRSLEQEIKTKDVLLEETVKAGMVLVNEIRNKEMNDGCTE